MRAEIKAMLQDHADSHGCQIARSLIGTDELVATLRQRVTMKEDVAFRALCVILDNLVEAEGMDHLDAAFHIDSILGALRGPSRGPM